MNTREAGKNAPWAIVIADDHGAQGGVLQTSAGETPPLQYSLFDGSETLFYDALQRAMRIAPASHVLLTALEPYRHYWEPAAWFVRPEHRFVSNDPGMSWLTTACAILAVAYQAPESIITLLPGRCFVAHETVLGEAIDRAITLLPLAPESVISLGMQDLDPGTDEDYLVPVAGDRQLLQPLLGVARRPVPWIARYLRAQGALVASRITCGYARTLAAHISLVWPGLASRLLEGMLTGGGTPTARHIGSAFPDPLPRAMLRSRHWYPPALPQRALRVRACGWSGLRTPRAVSQVTSFLSPAPEAMPAGLIGRVTVPASTPGSV